MENYYRGLNTFYSMGCAIIEASGRQYRVELKTNVEFNRLDLEQWTII